MRVSRIPVAKCALPLSFDDYIWWLTSTYQWHQAHFNRSILFNFWSNRTSVCGIPVDGGDNHHRLVLELRRRWCRRQQTKEKQSQKEEEEQICRGEKWPLPKTRPGLLGRPRLCALLRIYYISYVASSDYHVVPTEFLLNHHIGRSADPYNADLFRDQSEVPDHSQLQGCWGIAKCD